MTRVLEVTSLRVERAGRTLLVADLGLEAGACASLVGPAGCGKSSLAAALAGVLPATGEVVVDGRRLRGLPARRRRLGLVAVLPDEPSPSGCTVAELLALAARAPRTAASALEHFPLIAGRRHLDAGRLSGGERQLLRLAAAWAANPRVLVVDGAAAGLAHDVAEDVRALVRDEAARGAAVLWLDQPGSALPAPPRWTVEDGALSPTPSPTGTPPATQTRSTPAAP